MNIMEYRAMKAQEEADKAKGETSNAQTQSNTTEPTNPPSQTNQSDNPSQTSGTESSTQTTSSETKTEQPTKVSIEGLGEVDLEELKKGYLRQSDYTKKTQSLAEQQRQLEKVSKLYEAVQANPERAEMLAKEFNVPHLDPKVDYVVELQQKYQDLLLEKEINELSSKYPDFDAQTIIPFALQKKFESLEDAYLLHKSQNPTSEKALDVDAIKEQIRQDLLKELELERNTQSIIGGGSSAPPTNNQPTLSKAELRVATNMRMTPEDYIKWRDKR